MADSLRVEEVPEPKVEWRERFCAVCTIGYQVHESDAHGDSNFCSRACEVAYEHELH